MLTMLDSSGSVPFAPLGVDPLPLRANSVTPNKQQERQAGVRPFNTTAASMPPPASSRTAANSDSSIFSAHNWRLGRDKRSKAFIQASVAGWLRHTGRRLYEMPKHSTHRSNIPRGPAPQLTKRREQAERKGAEAEGSTHDPKPSSLPHVALDQHASLERFSQGQERSQ